MTAAYAARDTATMVRRGLRHMRRYPALTVMLIMLPVVFLLLFVYVFGTTLGNGLGRPIGGRGVYVDYVSPAVTCSPWPPDRRPPPSPSPPT